MQRLYKHTSLIISNLKKLRQTEGHQMTGYPQEEWAMQLSSKDKKFVTKMPLKSNLVRNEIVF